jgi:uncharacterized HNH endonuclease L245|nr:MAG TPA: homing endonuclease [Caudoviricetes sp.]
MSEMGCDSMLWKQLDMFDGRFYISEYGDVYNSVTDHMLTPYLSNKGYKMVDLNYNGQRQKYYVHRLVAFTYLPNPENYPIVLHLDSNPLNCHFSNLKWGTYSENNKQAVREGHMIVPKPDNRKLYSIYHDHGQIERICYGVNDIIKQIGFGNDSQIRNYIFRKTEIPYGNFKGYKIRRV